MERAKRRTPIEDSESYREEAVRVGEEDGVKVDGKKAMRIGKFVTGMRECVS